MPYNRLSGFRHLIVAVICLVVGQAVSGAMASARSGFVVPEQEPQTWSDPFIISNPDEPVDSVNADIAVCEDGTVYVVWEQGGKIWYRVNKPEVGWTQASLVWPDAEDASRFAPESEPAIVVSPDCVLHVVFSKFWFGNNDIFYASGEGFPPPVNISRTSPGGASYQPDIAVDSNGGPRVVWIDTVNGKRQVFEGWPARGFPGRWSKESITVVGDAQVPVLAVDYSDRFHLAWMRVDRSGSSDVLYKWQEQADQWPLGRWYNISDSQDFSTLPDIAISGNRVAVVWQETVNGDEEIYVKWRRLDSYNFVSPSNLSNTDNSSRAPAVTVDGLGDFFVAWDEGGAAEAIWTRFWSGIGRWSEISKVSSSETKVKKPAVAASPRDSHAYVVWSQKDGSEDTWDIYFSEVEIEVHRFYLALISNRYEP